MERGNFVPSRAKSANWKTTSASAIYTFWEICMKVNSIWIDTDTQNANACVNIIYGIRTTKYERECAHIQRFQQQPVCTQADLINSPHVCMLYVCVFINNFERKQKIIDSRKQTLPIYLRTSKRYALKQPYHQFVRMP